MNLNKKLSEWQSAGLIDEETVNRISSHESHQRKPLLLYAISGIGALSLSLGIISIVAANWHQIPSFIKLILDLLVGMSLCAYLAFKGHHLSKWVKEIVIAIMCSWTLASIALIGQVYQLNGNVRSALTFWTLLTVPLLLQGRSTLSGTLLLGSLGITGGLWLEHLGSMHGLTILPGSALAILGLRFYQPIYHKRPEVVNVFGYAAGLSILIAASCIPLAFYHQIKGKDLQYIYEAFFLSLPGFYWIWTLVKHAPRTVRWSLIASILCMFIPLLPHPKNLDLIAILLFTGYWSLLAKTTLDLGWILSFRIATFLVATRLVIMYFELVGSLLDTGLLFLTGGALILFMTRFWYVKQQALLSGISPYLDNDQQYRELEDQQRSQHAQTDTEKSVEGE